MQWDSNAKTDSNPYSVHRHNIIEAHLGMILAGFNICWCDMYCSTYLESKTRSRTHVSIGLVDHWNMSEDILTVNISGHDADTRNVQVTGLDPRAEWWGAWSFEVCTISLDWISPWEFWVSYSWFPGAIVSSGHALILGRHDHVAQLLKATYFPHVQHER